MATGRATTRRVQWSTSIGRPLRARLAALVSLVLVALAFGGHGRADAPGDVANQDVLARRIEAAIANADLGEQVGVSVVNLRSGRSIVGHNATTVLNPASNMKLVTAAVAMLESFLSSAEGASPCPRSGIPRATPNMWESRREPPVIPLTSSPPPT